MKHLLAAALALTSTAAGAAWVEVPLSDQLRELRTAAAMQKAAVGSPAHKPFFVRTATYMGYAVQACLPWARKTYEQMLVDKKDAVAACAKLTANAVVSADYSTSIMAYVTDASLIVTCVPRAAGNTAPAVVDDPAALTCDLIR